MMVVYNSAREDSSSIPGVPFLPLLDASLAQRSNLFPFDCTIPDISVCRSGGVFGVSASRARKGGRMGAL